MSILRRGFTLIELLVVVAIIALLASIVFSALSGVRENVQLTAGKQQDLHINNGLGDKLTNEFLFSECSGSATLDNVSLGTAILNGSPTWSTDTPYNRGCSLQFTGTNSVRLTPSNSVSGSFTVSLWAKQTSISGVTNTVFTTRSPQEMSFDFQLNGGTTIHGDIGSGTAWLTTAADAGYAYSLNKWYFIVYSVKSGGSYNIYVNGAEVRSGSFTGTPLLYNSTHTINIGGGNGFFRGLIDDVRIYSSALTAADVQTIYAAEANKTFAYLAW